MLNVRASNGDELPQLPSCRFRPASTLIVATTAAALFRRIGNGEQRPAKDTRRRFSHALVKLLAVISFLTAELEQTFGSSWLL